jgi:DNA-binding beta-propeller fold protein YncE
MKIVRYFFAILFLLVLFWLAMSHATAQLKPTPVSGQVHPPFRGTLLVASDADQTGTAYADQRINRVAGINDSLSLLRFDPDGNPTRRALHVSNSVISWPSVIAHSPDGRLAYIVETRAPFVGNEQKVKNVYQDMPQGAQVTVVDISAPDSFRILQKKAVGINLSTVSVNAKGDLLVTSSQEKGKELVIARLAGGRLDQVYTFPVSGLDRKGINGGVHFVTFHPSLDVIALIRDNRYLRFFEVNRTNGQLTIEPLGEELLLGKVLSVGNFTPDGRFFLVTDVGWGDSQLGNVLNSRGRLISVRFDTGGAHGQVSAVKVGLSPEGFDISPDGKWAVTANMRRTYLPKGFPFSLFAARRYASLSLVKIDPATGQLKVTGPEYGFEGELPEDAVFDLDGRNLAVAIYNQRFESFPRQGYIEFWRLEEEQLVRTARKVALTRGPHSLLLVKDR